MARNFGIPYDEYRLMTVGQINDLAVCQAIANGSMEESIIITGDKFPTWLR